MAAAASAPVRRAVTRRSVTGSVLFLLINLAVATEAFLVTGSLLTLPIALLAQAGEGLARLRGGRTSPAHRP